jgi:hypothetical protein
MEKLVKLWHEEEKIIYKIIMKDYIIMIWTCLGSCLIGFSVEGVEHKYYYLKGKMKLFL